jgi:hypothetical protein|tara:strand:- start:238 stop:480 length:243 start_codon:yes stop_codon:yes gene_type:complete
VDILLNQTTLEIGAEHKNYFYKVCGKSNSEYAKDPQQQSVNSRCTYLNGALIRFFCKMMPVVALSTTKAELYAAVLQQWI